MGMERRWGMRKEVNVEAVIDYQPNCLLRGRIGNISIGGLFVKTDATALRLNAPIELVLLLNSRSGVRVYRLPAIVARLTPEGAGLMFDQYDVSAFRTLVVLLLEQQKNFVNAAKRRGQAATTVSTEDDDEYVDLVAGGAESSAMDAGAFAPVLQQLSPLFGESHRKKVLL